MESAAAGGDTPRVPTSARRAIADEGPTPLNTALKEAMEVSVERWRNYRFAGNRAAVVWATARVLSICCAYIVAPRHEQHTGPEIGSKTAVGVPAGWRLLLVRCGGSPLDPAGISH